MVPATRSAPPGRRASVLGESRLGASKWWVSAADAFLLVTWCPPVVVADAGLAALVAWLLGAGPRALAVGPILVVVGAAGGLYRQRSTVAAQGVTWCLRAVLPVLVFGVPATWALVPLGGEGVMGGLATVALAVAALVLLRATAWVVVAAARRRGSGLRLALVVADGEEATDLRAKLATFPETGLAFGGSWPPGRVGQPPPGRAEHVLVGAGVAQPEALPVVEACRLAGVPVTVVLGASPVGLPWDSPRIGDLAVANLAVCRRRSLSPLVKRSADLVLALVLLVALAPLMALVSAAIRLDDGGAVLYRQQRVGRGGSTFVILKFRSMVPDAERLVDQLGHCHVGSGLLHKFQGDPRVTKVGAVIRRWAVDELPQLWNVVRGEMSLVGPRPLPVLPSDFDPYAMRRHDVRPGLTGPWQVEGANALTYDAMIRLDLAYVATWSVGLDLRILARTVPAVVVRRSAF